MRHFGSRPPATWLRVAFATLALAVVPPACGQSARTPTASSPVAGPATLGGTLVSGCFGWPATAFSESNKATVRTFLAPGARAVDFTLEDPRGGSHTLSELLATRPVLLVHGSFT